MGNLIPESLVWLDQIESLKGKTRKEWRAELKKVHDLSSSQITNLLAVKACFDQTAFDKVRQAEKANPSFTLSLNSAMALAGLKGKVSDLSSAIHSALDMTLTRRLATKKIKNLVKWIISGKPASEFDPNKKTTGTKEDKTEEDTESPQSGNSTSSSSQQASVSSLDLKKIRQFLEKAEEERIRGNETTAQEKLENYILKVAASLTGSKGSKTASASDEVISETVLLDWVADVNIFKQLKAKRKKGKSLTGKEWGLLVVNKAGELLGHAIKLFIKFFKPFLKLFHGVLKLAVQALKVLGLYDYAKAGLTILAMIAGIWFAWQAIHYGVMRPIEFAVGKIFAGHRTESPTSQEPAPVRSEELGSSSPKSGISTSMGSQESTSNSKLPTHHSPPAAAYQPAVSFIPIPSSAKTLYDPKILELEIAAIPKNSIVKDYPMTPDEGMPADLAVSRMQDLTDADKYTMMIGGSKQIIQSVNAANSTLTIQFKSADPFDVLGGYKSPLNVFWEDLQYIHANEIDILLPNKSTQVIYQCSLVVSGAKYPLTIQCASGDDLEHLVSTMEFFIRTSRLGRDTALAGLPYPTQGLRLNNDCVVEKLWANSPMAKTDVGLGEIIWSVDINAFYPPDRKKLGATLAGLAPGAHNLFVASHSDWDQAQSDVAFHRVGSLNPKRRKVILTVL